MLGIVGLGILKFASAYRYCLSKRIILRLCEMDWARRLPSCCVFASNCMPELAWTKGQKRWQYYLRRCQEWPASGRTRELPSAPVLAQAIDPSLGPILIEYLRGTPRKISQSKAHISFFKHVFIFERAGRSMLSLSDKRDHVLPADDLSIYKLL